MRVGDQPLLKIIGGFALAQSFGEAREVVGYGSELPGCVRQGERVAGLADALLVEVHLHKVGKHLQYSGVLS